MPRSEVKENQIYNTGSKIHGTGSINYNTGSVPSQSSKPGRVPGTWWSSMQLNQFEFIHCLNKGLII
jgi:hypothetical protein